VCVRAHEEYGPKYGHMNRDVYADRTCEPKDLEQVNNCAAHERGEWNVSVLNWPMDMSS
jgi:hypothetical protein